MKKAEKVLKNAELPEQNLPSAPGIPAQNAGAGAVQPSSTTSSTPPEAVAATDSSSAPVAATPASVSAATATASSSPADDGRLRALERTHDLVALHAVRLQESASDTMRVVFKPGDGMHLSLELRWRDNAVEAQATLHRGDFEFLSQHWSELQQRLEPRGIHLAPLGMAESFTSNFSQSRNSGRQAGDPEPATGAFAEYAFGGSMTESPAARRTRTKTHRGWETWA